MEATTLMRVSVTTMCTTFCQLLVISAVLLSASLTGSAQKMRGMDHKPASSLPDQATIQRRLHVLPTTLRPMRKAVGTAVHSQPQALQTWTGSFKVTTGENRSATTQSYSYTMVGTDPSAKGGSATTIVRTIIVPLRLEFADGSVLDASTDTTGPLNTSAVNNILRSPQFTPSPVYSGSTNLGNTQYADAIQRGSLWNYVSRNKLDYHVLLKPEVYPTQTLVVPANEGQTYTDPSSGLLYGVFEGAIEDAISNIAIQLQDPSALIIFVTHNVLPCSACYGYHDVLPLAGGLEQTYIITGYYDQNIFPQCDSTGCAGSIADIETLSHEISEWLNDPFADNIVPAWGDVDYPSPSCSTPSILEVGDPLVTVAKHQAIQEVGGVTWHPQDIVFLPWFEQASPSTSVNGWYTFANATPAPSEPCLTSGDYNYTALDFPQADITQPIGLNNLGTVVGTYDLAGVSHGFLYQHGQYTTLDVPGAAATVPQGINDRGQIVGVIFDSAGYPHGGFSYRAGVFKQIDVPGALYTAAFGINNSGVIVGFYADADNFTPYGYNLVHTFQLSDGVFTTLDAPPFAYESVAYSINNSGKIVGGYDNNGDQSQNYAWSGYPWSYAPFTLPGATGAPLFVSGLGSDSQTIPSSLNDLNDVVGSFYEHGLTDGYYPQAFVWYGEKKTWQRLEVPGAWYTELYGINNQGKIVGLYQDSTGTHGVVLAPAGK